MDDLKEIHDLVVQLDIKVRAFRRNQLRRIRLIHGIRGENLSREMGFSHSYWSTIETGKRAVNANLLSDFYLAITALKANNGIPRLQSVQPQDDGRAPTD